MQEAQINPGPFDGLWMLELRVIDDDERPGSSFREVWRAEHARQLGLPDLAPSQWSVAESPEGTLRGIHAEPWDKLVHDSSTAGQVWTGTLGPSIALFVGRGLGNSYQVTSTRAVYAYLVNGRWERDVAYPAVRWNDPDLAIDWPITDERLAMSKKDRVNPTLEEHWASASK